jgi:hypothetical protein
VEEERGLINDLRRYGRLAVAWNRHGSPQARESHGAQVQTPSPRVVPAAAPPRAAAIIKMEEGVPGVGAHENF